MHLSFLVIAFALTSSSLAAPTVDQNAAIDPLPKSFPKRTTCETGCECCSDRAQTAIEKASGDGGKPIQVNDASWQTLYFDDNDINRSKCFLQGRAVSGATSSFARDIGYGAGAIFNLCTQGIATRGSNTAGGNGDFLVRLIGCNEH